MGNIISYYRTKDQEVFCDSYELLNIIRKEIINFKKEPNNIIPFYIEPSFKREIQLEVDERIEKFIDNPNLVLKWIGESDRNVADHQYIYRDSDGDIFTFWRKNDTNYSIKSYIHYSYEPINLSHTIKRGDSDNIEKEIFSS